MNIGLNTNLMSQITEQIQHAQLQFSYDMSIAPTNVFHPDASMERGIETVYEPIVCGRTQCRYSSTPSPEPSDSSIERCRQ